MTDDNRIDYAVLAVVYIPSEVPLLTDLSGRFVNLPAEQVGTEIQRAQQSIDDG